MYVLTGGAMLSFCVQKCDAEIKFQKLITHFNEHLNQIVFIEMISHYDNDVNDVMTSLFSNVFLIHFRNLVPYKFCSAPAPGNNPVPATMNISFSQ